MNIQIIQILNNLPKPKLRVTMYANNSLTNICYSLQRNSQSNASTAHNRVSTPVAVLGMPMSSLDTSHRCHKTMAVLLPCFLLSETCVDSQTVCCRGSVEVKCGWGRSWCGCG